ncbi:MAG TPA: flavin reductase family protein [Chitinophagaceae bacterium]|nr:flavin reductase family protein [Chitinophagaceae bacterium]
MRKRYTKHDFPVDGIRRYLEPGPIVLVSSSYKGTNNIMTMGWYTLMQFKPSLIGCFIVGYNHSHDMIRKSKECVINLPTVDLLQEIIGIGNCHGKGIDKFEQFALTALPSERVRTPLIKECYANFECKIKDDGLLDKYSFFILEVVKAHVPKTPKYPKTVHYTGDGVFMLSGDHVGFPEKFRPENL